MEETIAGADVIARVELRSVTAVAERRSGETDYVGALDYRFRVLEYLRGSGGSELVGVVYDSGESFSSSQSAITRANALKDRRDTQWDSREAIILLEDAHPALPSSSQADRYRMGAVSYHKEHEDYYTIASRWGKRWLPAASAAGSSRARAPSSGSKAQLFLLDVPASATSGRASGRSAASAPTITLGDMKAKVASNDAAIAAGGGSEAYKDCLYLKRQWEREVQYIKEQYAPFDPGRDYYYIRYDEAIASGLASETLAHTSVHADVFLQEYGNTPLAGNWGEFRIVGRDQDLFNSRWPGVAKTVRPLPEGTYKFYWAYRPPEYIICDAHPQDELERLEVLVTVTAPTGTVHEAYFDPVAIGSGVGADASNGVLEPTSFTSDSVNTALQSLKWENGSVTLTLSSPVSLSGHFLDFIALDGTVTFSLDGGAATVSGKTLTWSVATQPWQAGDKLMLRLRQTGAGTPTPTATSGP